MDVGAVPAISTKFKLGDDIDSTERKKGYRDDTSGLVKTRNITANENAIKSNVVPFRAKAKAKVSNSFGGSFALAA